MPPPMTRIISITILEIRHHAGNALGFFEHLLVLLFLQFLASLEFGDILDAQFIFEVVVEKQQEVVGHGDKGA